MSNIDSINKNKKSSMDWSLVDTLRQLANQIERGEAEYNKGFICLLNDKGDFNYSTGFRMAQMKGSEAISLLEIMKSDLLNGINGLPSSFRIGE